VKTPPDLLEAIEIIARAMAPTLARAVVAELQAGALPDMIDQHASPLGPRRHVAAIRSGKLRGVQVGRRWLAKREDVDAYVATLTSKKNATPESDEAALARELGIAVEGARH
jgi:excisionase family DNA binding protein